MKMLSMTEMQFRIQEVKKAASDLKQILDNIEKNKSLFAPLGKTYDAVREILKCKLRNEEPREKDFKQFLRALYSNKSSDPQLSDYGLAKAPASWRNPPPHPAYTQRGIAEVLNRYLQCFVRTPRLEKHNPLGLCRICGALIEEQRSTRKLFCSSKCRSANYNKDHIADIRKKVSENRKAVKAMKDAKKKSLSVKK